MRWYRASMLVSAVLALAHSLTGCSGGCSAGVGYTLSPVTVPGNVDCTLTLIGASNQASYDCPAPPTDSCSSCTAQGSAPPIEGSFSGVILCPQGDDVGPYFQLGINDTSSQMRSYLGGSSFLLTLTCGGASITQVQGQFAKTQYCEG